MDIVEGGSAQLDGGIVAHRVGAVDVVSVLQFEDTAAACAGGAGIECRRKRIDGQGLTGNIGIHQTGVVDIQGVTSQIAVALNDMVGLVDEGVAPLMLAPMLARR